MEVEALLAVIETGNYTKAAQKLNLTQPAVSHQIRLLEGEFDVKIFYRSRNRLKLTPQGKVLVQYARKAAAVYSNACQTIADSRTEANHLNVDITPTTGETIIPQVLATFCNGNPNIHINICINAIQKIYSRLKAYKLDFAVVEGGMPDTALVSVALDTSHLCLAISPIHRLSGIKAVSVEKIRHEKLILCSRSAGTGQPFEKHLGARNMSLAEFNVMMELDNMSMIKGLITMGLGITITAKSTCCEELTSGHLAIIPIENSPMVRQIDMIYQKDFLYPEPVRNVWDIYKQLKAK